MSLWDYGSEFLSVPSNLFNFTRHFIYKYAKWQLIKLPCRENKKELHILDCRINFICETFTIISFSIMQAAKPLLIVSLGIFSLTSQVVALDRDSLVAAKLNLPVIKLNQFDSVINIALRRPDQPSQSTSTLQTLRLVVSGSIFGLLLSTSAYSLANICGSTITNIFLGVTLLPTLVSFCVSPFIGLISNVFHNDDAAVLDSETENLIQNIANSSGIESFKKIELLKTQDTIIRARCGQLSISQGLIGCLDSKELSAVVAKECARINRPIAVPRAIFAAFTGIFSMMIYAGALKKSTAEVGETIQTSQFSTDAKAKATEHDTETEERSPFDTIRRNLIPNLSDQLKTTSHVTTAENFGDLMSAWSQIGSVLVWLLSVNSSRQAEFESDIVAADLFGRATMISALKKMDR